MHPLGQWTAGLARSDNLVQSRKSFSLRNRPVQLEHVVLFERTGRGLLPTEMALRLADSARAMEGNADQLARSVSGAQAGISGTVRITASQPVACHDAHSNSH